MITRFLARRARRLAAGLAAASVLTMLPLTALHTTGLPWSSSTRSTTSTGIIVAVGHGWTRTGLAGPMPAAGSCHLRHSASGEPLPDPRCTPGAIDTAVGQNTLSSTVCRRGGYTSSVRPPAAITEPAKRQLMAAYGIAWSQASHYELDHLIELSAGGASDLRNLWPEPNTLTVPGSAFVHNNKDAVEAETFRALCTGRVSLAALQAAVASDWTTTLHRLHLPELVHAGGGVR